MRYAIPILFLLAACDSAPMSVAPDYAGRWVGEAMRQDMGSQVRIDSLDIVVGRVGGDLVGSGEYVIRFNDDRREQRSRLYVQAELIEAANGVQMTVWGGGVVFVFGGRVVGDEFRATNMWDQRVTFSRQPVAAWKR